ncbi:MAG TPA: hypothetical protein VI752_01800 [Candidatus Paceibacterota bacterium]
MSEGTFLGNLREKMDGIDEPQLVAPSTPLAEGEEVVGVVQDLDTKRLYTILQVYHERQRELIKVCLHEKVDAMMSSLSNGRDHSGVDHDSSTCSACQSVLEINRIKEDFALLEPLFWADVKSQINEYKKGDSYTIELRSGWEIVAAKPESEVSALFQMLTEIFSEGRLHVGGVGAER